MKTKILTMTLFLVSALVFRPDPASLQGPSDPDTAAVRKDSLPVYSANSPGADIVKILSKGDLVRVRMSLIGSEGTWCLISEEGKTESLGYVPCEDLEYLRDDSKKAPPAAGQPNRQPPMEADGKIAGSAPSGPAESGALYQPGLGSLLQAIWQENVPAVREMLERGVSPNARTPLGAIPLHIAAKKNSEATRLLIAHGADTNAQDKNGLTPLMAAASAGQVHNVELLLAAGAEINARDEQGFTPLMWAVMQGSPQGVDTLLGNNADVNLRSRDGRTALWLSKQLLANTRKSLAAAFRKNSDELIKELRRKLANGEEIFQTLQSSGGKE